LPPDAQPPSYASEIAVAPDGKHLYVANRGHDSIAVFDINEASGKLAMSSVAPVLGKFPRHFSIDPSGKWMVVADQNSGDVFVFAIDAKSGKLTPTGSSVKVPGPTCIRFWTQWTK
jgi:6-phosphogluconolactonase